MGQYNECKISIIYEALSWLIFQQSKNLVNGCFILKVVPNTNNKENVGTLPNTNILPEVEHEISIEYKGKLFNIKYKLPEKNNNNTILNNINSEIISMIAQEKLSIYLTTINNSSMSVDDIYELLNDVTNYYLEFQKKESGCFRYENTQSYWNQIQKLSFCRGLESIALDIQQELLLKKKLNSLKMTKFYKKLGLPYRRGILLYGKSGTEN